MKKNNIVLPDTNMILRYLLKDHAAHFSKAKDLFGRIRSGHTLALVLESVLIECVYVLEKYYNVPRAEIAKVLSELLHYKGIQNKDIEALLAALELFRKKTVDIVDCLLIAKHTQEGYQIATFDKAIQKELR